MQPEKRLKDIVSKKEGIKKEEPLYSANKIAENYPPVNDGDLEEDNNAENPASYYWQKNDCNQNNKDGGIEESEKNNKEFKTTCGNEEENGAESATIIPDVQAGKSDTSKDKHNMAFQNIEVSSSNSQDPIINSVVLSTYEAKQWNCCSLLVLILALLLQVPITQQNGAKILMLHPSGDVIRHPHENIVFRCFFPDNLDVREIRWLVNGTDSQSCSLLDVNFEGPKNQAIIFQSLTFSFTIQCIAKLNDDDDDGDDDDNGDGGGDDDDDDDDDDDNCNGDYNDDVPRSEVTNLTVQDVGTAMMINHTTIYHYDNTTESPTSATSNLLMIIICVLVVSLIIIIVVAGVVTLVIYMRTRDINRKGKEVNNCIEDSAKKEIDYKDEGNAEVKETDHRKNVSESVHTLTKTNADGKEIDHQGEGNTEIHHQKTDHQDEGSTEGKEIDQQKEIDHQGKGSAEPLPKIDYKANPHFPDAIPSVTLVGGITHQTTDNNMGKMVRPGPKNRTCRMPELGQLEDQSVDEDDNGAIDLNCSIVPFFLKCKEPKPGEPYTLCTSV